MSFAQPVALVLLAVPLWVLLWVWRRNAAGRRVALPFDHGKQGAGKTWRVLIDLAESLPALILMVVIILLAGPQQTGEPKTKRKLNNIEFCVDVSGSMTAPFGSGSRYDMSLNAINDFLDFRTGDSFGLTFFGSSVLHWVPLTNDVSAFCCAPPFMRPEKVPPWMGGTMIGKALNACKEILVSRDEGDRMIILVSDGGSFDLAGGNDEAIAKTLKANRIVVNAIHISEGEIPPTIITVARGTGGDVYTPNDPETLKQVFERIDEMRETKLEKVSAETIDNFKPFCIAGLSLLGLSGLTLLGLRYNPW